jgi:hypothetical protein
MEDVGRRVLLEPSSSVNSSLAERRDNPTVSADHVIADRIYPLLRNAQFSLEI